MAIAPGLTISYMGTKRQLAGAVASVISKAPPGPILDLFAGMCAIGRAVAPSRNIWTNDFLRFPELVAKCFFTHRKAPRPSIQLRCALSAPFWRNHSELARRWSASLKREEAFLRHPTRRTAREACDNLPFVANSKALERLRSQYELKPSTFPYCQTTLLYAGSFFSLRQCIEIDSIVFSIDECMKRFQITSDEADWLRAALCASASRVNNSTGQFAQYLRPRSTNLDRIVRQNRRSVWEELWKPLREERPVGLKEWRAKNRVYRREASDLLVQLRRRGLRPAVVYADPPYSLAQYSRYYHVLEALLEYRYPQISGVGRYYAERVHTGFSCREEVVKSMETLARTGSECTDTLILSYPARGVLHLAGHDPAEILRAHFRSVRRVRSLAHSHSSFGGQRGAPKVDAREYVYVARA